MTENIISLTGLSQRYPAFINDKDRQEIIEDLRKLMKEFNPPTYISQRFLNQDLKLFVGLPGSGKKTFKNYMRDMKNKEVKVVGLEEYNKKSTSTYEVLKNTIFLDWNYQEATQAVVKWFLQSQVFYSWFSSNNRISQIVSIEELEHMRNSAEYELEDKVANEILNVLFGESDTYFSGWYSIFGRISYRDNFVLPKDIMMGVKLYIEYILDNREPTRLVEALFKVEEGNVIGNFKDIWRTIGLEKKIWIKNYDEQIYHLIKAFSMSMELPIVTKDAIPSEQTKKMLLQVNKNLKEELFAETFNNAIRLNIFMRLGIFDENEYWLTWVYDLIDFSDEEDH